MKVERTKSYIIIPPGYNKRNVGEWIELTDLVDCYPNWEKTGTKERFKVEENTGPTYIYKLGKNKKNSEPLNIINSYVFFLKNNKYCAHKRKIDVEGEIKPWVTIHEYDIGEENHKVGYCYKYPGNNLKIAPLIIKAYLNGSGRLYD